MKRLLWLVLAAGLIALGTAQAEDLTPDTVLQNMLKGVENADVGQFTYRAEPDLKQRVTREVMIRLSGSLGPKLKKGYTSTNLGQLRQQGLVTHLYKLQFKDGTDDVLIRLAVRDGAVAGIFFE